MTNLLCNGEISFIVCDELQYPNDIETLLNNGQYITFPEYKKSLDSSTPAIITSAMTDHMYPQNPNYRHIIARNLNEKDIVVNKQFHQIWPANTGKYPIKMVELFKKKTERIY